MNVRHMSHLSLEVHAAELAMNMFGLAGPSHYVFVLEKPLPGREPDLARLAHERAVGLKTRRHRD